MILELSAQMNIDGSDKQLDIIGKQNQDRYKIGG